MAEKHEGEFLPQNVQEQGNHADAGTSDEALKKINQFFANAGQCGIPLAQFTPAVINAQNMTVDAFCKLGRVFRQFTNLEAQERVLGLGIAEGYFQSPTHITPAIFIRFCKFLKSKAGQEAMQRLRQRAKMERKIVGEQSVEDVTLVTMLNIQNRDWRAEVKRVRKGYEERMGDLRRQIKLVEREMKQKMETIKAKYLPGVAFEEPSKDVILGQCYEMYVADAHGRGHVPLPKNGIGLATAYAMFGQRFLTEMRTEFAKQGENREALVAYFSQKVNALDQSGDTKLAITFRNYLASIGAQIPAPPTATQE